MIDLTTTQKQRARQILNISHNPDGVVYRDITYAQLGCLKPHGWLNDQVINGCIDRWQQALEDAGIFVFNTFFMELIYNQHQQYNQQAAARYLRRRSRDLDTARMVCAPVHRDGNHWGFVVADMRAQKLWYADSLNRSGQEYMQVMRQYLMDRYETDVDWDSYDIHNNIQNNGYDCGVYCLYVLYCLLADLPFTEVDQSDLDTMRLYITLLLAEPDSLF